MPNITKQAGFTLIELVVVIVLLGILAVTALPRFVNLQSDARIAAIESLAGTMRAAANQVYAKSLVNGAIGIGAADGTSTGSVDILGGTMEVSYGYPEADAESDLDMLDAL